MISVMAMWVFTDKNRYLHPISINWPEKGHALPNFMPGHQFVHLQGVLSLPVSIPGMLPSGAMQQSKAAFRVKKGKMWCTEQTLHRTIIPLAT
ncbi:hypothetical protein D3C72_2253220 [compost metagenome]